MLVPNSRAREVAREHNPALLKRHREFAREFAADRPALADHTLRRYLLEINDVSMLRANHMNYIHYYARIGTFDGSGARIRRESDLAGSTFRADVDLEPQHMEDLRGAIESVDASVVDTPDAKVDYVVVRDQEAAKTRDVQSGTEIVTLQEFSGLLQRTSTSWIGFTEHHIGADVVGQWYKRNLRIYANVSHDVEEDDNRVVLMMGQAHIWTLRRFFLDNPDFEVVPVASVL